MLVAYVFILFVTSETYVYTCMLILYTPISFCYFFFFFIQKVATKYVVTKDQIHLSMSGHLHVYFFCFVVGRKKRTTKSILVICDTHKSKTTTTSCLRSLFDIFICIIIHLALCIILQRSVLSLLCSVSA